MVLSYMALVAVISYIASVAVISYIDLRSGSIVYSFSSCYIVYRLKKRFYRI